MKRIKKISDVVSWRLCIGCGACAYVCPSKKIKLLDFSNEGIRPVGKEGADCGNCKACLEVCPGLESDFGPLPVAEAKPAAPSDFEKEWGPVLELWEGYATDPDIRYKGSSGGAITALSAYCLEVLGMHGVLHIGQDPDAPTKNRTRLSQTREQLMAAIGSRYSPASVCNGLDLVEKAPTPCAVVGKPGEIVAVRKAGQMRPELDKKVGVTFSFFCAETPSSHGTDTLLKKMGVPPDTVRDLKYRGHGWPGYFAPLMGGKLEPGPSMTYDESWAFLQSFRPWSVQLWPDGSGEAADISFGDAWYEAPDGVNAGNSLVAVRTERGREILKGAIEAGYLTLKQADLWKLPKSQGYLLKKKAAVHGRRLGMKLFGLPVTDLKNAHLKHCWKHLDRKEKFQAVAGTVKRILKRNLRRPLVLDPATAREVGKPVLASELMREPAGQPAVN